MFVYVSIIYIYIYIYIYATYIICHIYIIYIIYLKEYWNFREFIAPGCKSWSNFPKFSLYVYKDDEVIPNTKISFFSLLRKSNLCLSANLAGIITPILVILLPKFFYRTSIYLPKVKNRNTSTRCGICSKLKIKTPERRQ